MPPHPYPHPHRPLPGILPELDSLLNQQLALAQRQHLELRPRVAQVVGQPAMPSDRAPRASGTSTPASTETSDSMQQYIAQTEHQRLQPAARANGNSMGGDRAADSSDGRFQTHGNSRSSTPSQASLPNNLVPNTSSSVTREGVGPNGERWRVTVNNSTITFPPVGHGGATFQNPTSSLHPPTSEFHHDQHNPQAPAVVPVDPRYMTAQLQHVITQIEQAQADVRSLGALLGEIQTATTAGDVLDARYQRLIHLRLSTEALLGTLEQLATNMTNVLVNPGANTQRTVASIQALNERLRFRTGVLIQHLDRIRAAHGLPTIQNAAELPSGPPPSQSERLSNTSVLRSPFAPIVYLMSNPSGPYALVFSPEGTYASYTPSPASTAHGLAARQFNSLVNLQSQSSSSRPTAQPQGPALEPRAPAIVRDMGGHARHHRNNQRNLNRNHRDGRNRGANQNQNQNQNQGNQRDLRQLLVPLGGHLWLLVRVIGFIYLFAGGAGWTRPILLGLIGLIFYAAQIGLFGDRLERLRRYFEALLPLADEARPGAARNAGEAPGFFAVRPARRPRFPFLVGGDEDEEEPTPEQAAQRLVQEHQDRNRGRIREYFRSIERATALFIASLWPGVGERHIAAREEARRAREALNARSDAAQAAEAEGAQSEGPAVEASTERERPTAANEPRPEGQDSNADVSAEKSQGSATDREKDKETNVDVGSEAGAAGPSSAQSNA